MWGTEQQVRACVRFCIAAAFACAAGAVYMLVAGPPRWPAIVLASVAVFSLGAAWALPRGLEMLGEHHWLYSWTALRSKLRRS